MEIKTKEVADLTPIEYKACFKANFGYDGYMREILEKHREDGSHGLAIMLWEGPEDKTSSLLGWALLTETKDKHTQHCVYMTDYTKRKAKYVAQFWVKTRHRRKGLGKILMVETKKYDSRPFVLPHDPKSEQLFASFDVTVTKGDRAKLQSHRKPVLA